ncbi:MAG TPA: hypothetical protein VFG68_23495 [Fimbriiglobus sp.]|nr:hypothetical protein [Fimbriiglobus sp.]
MPRPTAALSVLCAGLLTACNADPPAAALGPDRAERLRTAKMPAIDKLVMFNTPEADAILAAMAVFPPDNPWNTPVADWPLHPDSKAMIAAIGADKPLRYNADMGFVLVPPKQPKVEVRVTGYPDESDKGPFPVPDGTPIEGWPAAYKRYPKRSRLTLDDVQRNKLNQEGDRHAIVVDPVNRKLYEFFVAKKTDRGWEAACAAAFDLASNKLRPDGWTSADAAGLPIFPAVVRYDELKRGRVEHAMRVTVRRTRKAYVYPATHHASRLTDADLPRMGERLRLRKDYDTSGFSPEVRVILEGLKKYGMFVADNGIEWAISVAPDERIPELHRELRKVKGSDFEVVTPPPGYKRPE